MKGNNYEYYVIISQEIFLKARFNILNDMIRHAIAECRQMNYFVKRVYEKFEIVSQGLFVYCLELIKMKEPKVEILGFK